MQLSTKTKVVDIVCEHADLTQQDISVWEEYCEVIDVLADDVVRAVEGAAGE